jgi:hypothetical protein
MPDAATLSWDAFQAAIDRLSGKTDIPSALRTEGWSRVPLAVRERAFMSAGVEDAKVLQTIRSRLAMALQGVDKDVLREDGTPASYSRENAIADIRKALGATGDSGRLTDITSYRRQKLIQDFQIEQAHAYGRYKQDLGTPALLDEYPAQALVRVEPRVHERDWQTRWQEAGNKVAWQGASRAGLDMIALKTSPIWAALSRFGTPFPPFDFQSGMGLEDVHRDRAIELGLIDKNWDAKKAGEAALEGFNKDAQASMRGLDAQTTGLLKDYLDGHGVDFKMQGGSVWLAGDEASRKAAQPQPGLARLAPSERFALRAYTDYDVAADLNRALREQRELTPRQSELAARIRGGLAGLPKHEGTVYRSTGYFPELDAYQPGAVKPQRGFTSTSTDPSVGPDNNFGEVRMVIKTRSGRKIANLSQETHESEVLITSGVQMKVTDRRWLDGVDTIFMEELP